MKSASPLLRSVTSKIGAPMFETLTYERRENVSLITLNRPARHNAVNSVMHRELPQVWAHFADDDQALVAIVTGAGERAFCSGADVGDLPVQPDDASLEAFRWTSLQNRVAKPVICAVNGMAIGGGLHFVADSDIVIASEDATFFDTHVKVGMVAGLEPVSLSRRMPMEAVLRMMLVGGEERITARRMMDLGAVGEVTAPAALLPRAFEVAAMIARHSPAAIARTKRAIWDAAELPLHEGLRNGWRLLTEHTRHADYAEGVAALNERRRPVWRPPSESAL